MPRVGQGLVICSSRSERSGQYRKPPSAVSSSCSTENHRALQTRPTEFKEAAVFVAGRPAADRAVAGSAEDNWMTFAQVSPAGEESSL